MEGTNSHYASRTKTPIHNGDTDGWQTHGLSLNDEVGHDRYANNTNAVSRRYANDCIRQQPESDGIQTVARRGQRKGRTSGQCKSPASARSSRSAAKSAMAAGEIAVGAVTISSTYKTSRVMQFPPTRRATPEALEKWRHKKASLSGDLLAELSSAEEYASCLRCSCRRTTTAGSSP